MNTFNRALKFLAFLQFKSTAIFSNQRTEQNIKLCGPVIGIPHAVRRYREPRSGLLHKNNKELFLNCLAPYPQGQDCFKQFPTPRPKDWSYPGDFPREGGGGGMVTCRIEPCITVKGVNHAKDQFQNTSHAEACTIRLVLNCRTANLIQESENWKTLSFTNSVNGFVNLIPRVSLRDGKKRDPGNEVVALFP